MANFSIEKYSKGFFISLTIAITATFVARITPSIIGSSIIALVLGMALNYFINSNFGIDEGAKFVSKRVLQVAIILMGTRLNINQVFTVGRFALFVMIFTVSAAYLSAYSFGKALNINQKLRALVGTGTAICGGSAILALSPIIDADENDIAYAISSVFLFDVLMIVIFPLIGILLKMSDLSFGLWAGTGINDTSSVVAAGYAFSNVAGDYATIVKLTRTTAIIPITLIYSAIVIYKGGKENRGSHKISNVFPWFILLFLLSSIINSLGLIPSNISTILSFLSKFLMTMALAAVGLKTNLKKMIKSGIKPIGLGFIASSVVVLVSMLAQYLATAKIFIH